MKLLAELKFRNVTRMAGLYPVGAWLFGSAVRGDFPPVADSGSSAALRNRGRVGSGRVAVSPSAFCPAGRHAAAAGAARCCASLRRGEARRGTLLCIDGRAGFRAA